MHSENYDPSRWEGRIRFPIVRLQELDDLCASGGQVEGPCDTDGARDRELAALWTDNTGEKEELRMLEI